MRIFLAFAVFISSVSMSLPASAAVCGGSTDVSAVETGTITHYNANLKKSQSKIDITYLKAIVVLGAYAQVDISAPQGLMSNYWIKKRGVWSFSGYFAPKGWPRSVRSKLTAMSNQRANGSKQCANPRFIPRGSG